MAARKWPNRERIRAAYVDEGMTMAQIGEELGCDPAAILYNLRKMGIPSRKTADVVRGRKVSAATKEAIGRANRGKIVSEVTRQRLSEVRKRLKWRARWHSGKRTKRDDGYVQTYIPEHPYASCDGYVFEHRLVMERHLGRYLNQREVVHHKNGIRNDNRIENLELFASVGEHTAYHCKLRKEKKECSIAG